MGTVIVSDSFMVRESIDNLLKSMYDTKNILLSNIDDISKAILLDVNYVILDIKEKEIEKLERIKNEINNKKIIVLDLAKNKTVCEKAIKNGVSGYILNIDNKEDFVYKINSIRKGKKFYDSDLLASILEEDKLVKVMLTCREKEVFELVRQGYTNKEIANKLFITEYTVKKHISSILSKMNFRSRKDIIMYMKV